MTPSLYIKKERQASQPISPERLIENGTHGIPISLIKNIGQILNRSVYFCNKMLKKCFYLSAIASFCIFADK